MRLNILIPLVALALLCGCHQTATTQPTAVAMGGGRVDSVFAKSVPDMTDAARALMLERKLVLVQYASGSQAGRVVAYTLDSKRVEIDVRPDPSGSRVRITTEGDTGDQYSMDLLQALQKAK